MRPILVSIILLPLLAVAQACERSAATDSGANVAPPTSAWVPGAHGTSALVVLTDEAVEELSASIEEAQETASDARAQFADALPHERLQFLVLWMAPTVDGSREFVWVRPIAWSPFRIEGQLLSTPTTAIESGSTAGETVSFPIEQLADWVILDAERPGEPAKGAGTLREIEKRIGSPAN